MMWTILFLQDIGGAKVLNDQVVITDTVSCPIGYMVIGDNCGIISITISISVFTVLCYFS